MIHSVRFTVVLDTNVIYPLGIRDLLFWFAHFELYTVKWSEHIFDEWKRIMMRQGVSIEEATRRVERAKLAFPDAQVHNYQSLVEYLTLPDKNDCHVMAAAIKANANLIVTNNLKDFPTDYLATFGLNAKTADDFLTDIIDLNHEQAVAAFREMVLCRKNPKQDEFTALSSLRRSGLKGTADYLHALL